MRFFRNPQDLSAWVKTHGAKKAASILVNLPKVGEEHFSDVVETTKRIAEASDANAADVLYSILGKAEIVGQELKQVEDGIEQVRAANELLAHKVIAKDEHAEMVKVAQIMRQPGQYDMPLRICPKLPWSVGKKLISTYNCRHYCSEGIVLDDDPMRVYCGELLWRRHVADKFSHDYQDRKTGELVGGYINERFFKFPDAGTPDNPDVARNGGNPMMLKPGERTRVARPHQWSIERRMQEAREKGSTKDVALNKKASSNWVDIMIQAQVQIGNMDMRSSATGTIIKTIGGVEVELDWTATIYDADDHMPDEVQFEWPENMMMGIEQTPGSWDGDVCNPHTGAMLVSAEDREKLENEWEQEVINAVYADGKTASSSVRIVEANNGKTVNPQSVCHATVDKDHLKKSETDEDVARMVFAAAGRQEFVKISSKIFDATSGDEEILKAFSMAIDLKNAGISDEDAAIRVADATGMKISKAVGIQSVALSKMAAHVSEVYSMDPSGKRKPGPEAKSDDEVQADAAEIGLLDTDT